MKFSAIILSIFILGLTLKPCADILNCEHDESEGISYEHTHDHSEGEEDSCGSICICACCGVTITYELLAQFDVAARTVIISKEDFLYQSEYTFYFLSNIWEPPQLIG